jgi:hypothetical protein
MASANSFHSSKMRHLIPFFEPCFERRNAFAILVLQHPSECLLAILGSLCLFPSVHVLREAHDAIETLKRNHPLGFHPPDPGYCLLRCLLHS